MFLPWFNLTMLAVESQHVIGLRLLKIAGGGSCAIDEAYLMVAEKIKASTRAAGFLVIGGSSDCVVREYRQIVTANARRLSCETAF